jgi:hypothetical protein
MTRKSDVKALKQRLFQLSSKAELQAIKLVQSSAELVPPGQDTELEDFVPPEQCRLEASLSHHGEAVVPPDVDDVIVCVARFELEGRNADHLEQVICRFSCAWLIVYGLEGASEEEDDALQFFADKNAVYNAWPFFREHVHSLTVKMDLPPFVAPLFKPRLDDD